ncbi:MAG TPA: hypothetical protein VIX17_11570 [Pyrinomonadaceae bacterium]
MQVESQIQTVSPFLGRSIEFSAPIRIVSEANDRSHWAVKHKRKTAQQGEMIIILRNVLRQNPKVTFPCVVTLTRIGPRRIDDDNLAGGCKFCRDAIAHELDIDDGDERIKFEYDQEVIGKREYGVRVKISW